jgi:hypothetical protein
MRFGWLGWKLIASAVVLCSFLLSYLAFRESQLQNRAWVSAVSAQTKIAVVPIGSDLDFAGTTVSLRNSGHEPALKVFMAGEFIPNSMSLSSIMREQERLCHALDHGIIGGQVIFPDTSVDFPVNYSAIRTSEVGSAKVLSGEFLIGCVSYADPSDSWIFLNGTRRHTTTFAFDVGTKMFFKGMLKQAYGFVPINKMTPGDQVVFTPSALQAGTAN